MRPEAALILIERGLDVETAYRIPASPKLMVETTYDLFPLNLIVPGTHRRALCKEMAEPPRAGIITVSSVSEDEGWIVLLGLGADDDIVKQFIMLELLARVRAFLRITYSFFRTFSVTAVPFRLSERS